MVVLALLSANVGAQDVLKLDLNKAIEIALTDNPTIQVADKEIELQKYVRRETIGNHLPNLSATGSYNYAIKKSEIDLGGGQKFSFEPTNTLVGAANLTLPLVVPAVYSLLRLNDEQMRAAVESARGSRITLVGEVKKSFYTILVAEQSLSVLKESEKNVQATVDQTRAMMENGLASEYELLTAEVQLSNMKPMIIQTENSIKVAKQMFKMYLYLPQDIEVEVVGELDDFQHEVLMSTGAFSTDISGNSDLALMDIQREILFRQFRVLQTNRMPTLAAFGNFQWMGRNKISLGAMSGGSGPAGEIWENQAPMSAGLQLSVPIFSGFVNVNKERQIKKSMEQLTLQRDYMVEGLVVQVENAISSLLTAQAQMIANEKTIAQAQKSYEITNVRYINGMGTILELNMAEVALTQAKLQYSQSIYDYLYAEAEYKKLLGTENI